MKRKRESRGEVYDKGTPETRGKNRASVVLRMWKGGRFTDQEYHWIMQIEHAAETLTSVVCPLGSEGAGGGGSKKPHIVGHLTDRQRVDVTKFINWQDKVKAQGDDKALAALMEVITDNLGINEAERVYGLGQRNGMKIFKKILLLWG